MTDSLPSLSPQDALVAVMIAVSASDGCVGGVPQRPRGALDICVRSADVAAQTLKHRSAPHSR